MTQNLMPSILDREIDSESGDAFGHRHFSAALESLIEAPDNSPPFSVGLLGPWGSGKSSIKAMYLKSLANNRSNGHVFPVTFNAWRYGGEDLKRALLRHVYLEVGGNKAALDDALFNQLEETVKRPLSWKEIGTEFYERFLWPTAQLLVTAGCVALIAYVIATAFDLSSPFGSAAVVAGITALGWKFIEQLPALNKVLLSRTAAVVRVDAPRSTAEQFEDLLVNQIKAFKKGSSLSGKGKKCERLVIFVDDLDRLSPEEMVAGLDAIRTFMEIPFESTGIGIIFVISCDEDRIADSLYRSKATTKELPGAVFSRSDARRYLDRIFQFRLEIPELPKRDMRAFTTERIRTDAPEIVTEIEKAGVALVNVIDRMIHVGVASPRNALQILNSFVQCWWIAKKREQVGPGTNRPGGLQQGAVTEHPISLAALSALRVDFPDFFHQLVAEPELIERFTAVFVRNEQFDDQPESTRTVLSKYRDKEGELLTEHRPLKRFLNGLAGLRWPKSLKPLLILSQDPITRKHGDKAAPLYDAFVSSDSEEVLRILGRDADERNLEVSEVRLLKDMVEDLERETPVRRDNAAVCLAELADRLPDDEAHHLLSPLARRLSRSPELRSRLGVDKIRKVLPRATKEDRQDVADNVISDLLLLEGDTAFRLPTGQEPVLDDAIQMARSACELALWVRDADGLSPATDQRLLTWLEVRRVSVGGKESTLPHAEFEEWVSQYEGSLLPALKDRYTHLVASQFEASAETGLPLDAVLARCKSVFDALWNEGRESQQVLWQQVSRFVAVRNESAVTLAYSQLVAHPEAPSDDEISRFVTAFANRLVNGTDDDETWSLDRRSGSEALLTVVTNRRSSLSAETEGAIKSLVDSWSTQDECGKSACDLLDVLIHRESELATVVVADWTGRLVTDLPSECAKWCCQHIESQWTDQQKTQTVKKLNQIVSKDDVPEEEAARYATVLLSLPPSSLDAPPLIGHLNHACGQIQSRTTNANYLAQVFPTTVAVLEHCEPAPKGEMLQQLFTTTRGDLPLYCWLHEQMVDRWPEADESTGAYSPEQIFNEAESTTNSSPGHESMSDVLRSMQSMSINGIGPADSEARIVEVACVLWPHHPDETAMILRTASVLPPADSIAELLESVSADSSDDLEQLTTLWKLFAVNSESSFCADVASALLNRAPVEVGDNLDVGLKSWIDCADEKRPAVLHTLLFQGDLTDEQRKRVWLQIRSRLSDLGNAFALEVLPDLLKLPESPETTRAAIDSQQDVNRLFPSHSEKYDLGKLLLFAFLSSPSTENQNRLVQWLTTLGVDDVLKELADLAPLSEEDLETLKTHFPGSRHLRKIKVQSGNE